MNAEIAAHANRTTAAEAHKMEQVAGEFRGKAISEVVETEREVEPARGMARLCPRTNKCANAQTRSARQCVVKRMNMKRKRMNFWMMGALSLSLALTPLYGIAQQNNNTSTGQMKESGTEVRKAGQSMGRNVRHGRIVRGGKHFGKHMGRAGKHFGRGTKKAVKHVTS